MKYFLHGLLLENFKELKLATDVGGTFTDLVHFHSNKNSNVSQIRITKTQTTPSDYEKGVLGAISVAEVDLDKQTFFIHGTTVVINSIIERKYSKTALLTTSGFRDVLEIGRGSRPDIFNLNFLKQPPLVERYLRMEINERMNYKGDVIRNLELKNLRLGLE